MDNEYAFLYCVLINKNALKEILYIDTNIFYENSVRIIINKAKELLSKDIQVSIDTIKHYVDEQVYDLLISNISKDINTDEYKTYLDAVQNEFAYSKLEDLKFAIDNGISSKNDPIVICNSIQTSLRPIYDNRTSGSVINITKTLERIDKDLFNTDIPHENWGIGKVDEILDIIEEQDLIVVGADPSMGKTAFVVDFIIRKSIYEKTPCLFIDVETSAKVLLKRMISNVGDINLKSIRLRQLTNRQQERYETAKENILNSPLYIIENESNLNGIISSIELFKNKNPDIKYFVVDFLQLVNSGISGTDNERVAYIIKELKRTAKKLNMIGVVVSQLSRTHLSREIENKRPKKSDLRDSGVIEQVADIIILLYRDDYFNQGEKLSKDHTSEIEIIIDKNRNGETGVAKIKFKKDVQRFIE